MKTWQAYLLAAALTGFACGYVAMSAPGAVEVPPTPPCAVMLCKSDSFAAIPPAGGRGMSLKTEMTCKCEESK